ncbi:MAG: phage terminase large subunit [Bacteroidota bacterium]
MIIDFSKYYIPKPKQVIAHKCKANFMLFGGAIGGSKSWFLCAEAIKQAMKYNGNRLVIVRKELSVMRRTIIVSFFQVCPPEIIRNYNQSSLQITFINGSVLTFIEANISKDPLLNKLKGLEIGWFGIDEANEVAEYAYKVLKTRLRWVLPDSTKPSYQGRLTSNPEACWLIPTFIQSNNPDEVYIQSLTTDNYSEDDDYVIQLKETFKDSPALLRKYLWGDWTLSDTINQLVPSESILNAEKIKDDGFGRSIGIDVARYGDDKTVFTVLINGNIELIESYAQTALNEIVTRAIQLMQDYKIEPEYVGIDSVGLGAGVVDSLKSMGYNVVEIQGGAKPIDLGYEESFKPFNLRSQMFYELRKDIIDGQIGNLSNEVLKLELQAIKYEIASDKTFRVIGKDVIKKLLGKSPDFADSLAYANWVKTNRGPYYGWINIYGGP